MKLILSHLVFKKTLERYFEKSGLLDINEIVEIMKESKLYGIESDETFKRRASTISGWIKWIIGLFEE